MKTIKELADEIGVSKTAIRNEIEKQGLKSSLRKNGNQFAIDENCESLIKSAFESRNGKVTAKVVCKDNVNQNTKVTENKNGQVCDYQNRINVLEIDNKRLQEEIELLKGQLAENKEEIVFLRNEVSEKNQIINHAQELQAMAENKVKLLENKQEDVVENVHEPVSESVDISEKKKWWEIWRKLHNGK